MPISPLTLKLRPIGDGYLPRMFAASPHGAEVFGNKKSVAINPSLYPADCYRLLGGGRRGGVIDFHECLGKIGLKFLENVIGRQGGQGRIVLQRFINTITKKGIPDWVNPKKMQRAGDTFSRGDFVIRALSRLLPLEAGLLEPSETVAFDGAGQLRELCPYLPASEIFVRVAEQLELFSLFSGRKISQLSFLDYCIGRIEGSPYEKAHLFGEMLAQTIDNEEISKLFDLFKGRGADPEAVGWIKMGMNRLSNRFLITRQKLRGIFSGDEEAKIDLVRKQLFEKGLVDEESSGFLVPSRSFERLGKKSAHKMGLTGVSAEEAQRLFEVLKKIR